MVSSIKIILTAGFIMLAMASCKKEKTMCTARSAQGEALYLVEGYEACQNQINAQQGEYCDCVKE